MRIFTLLTPVFVLTPEVAKLRFSNNIEGCADRRDDVETKKASRKWLAFNDFYSGGRIRTSDLRVMSPTSYQAALPRDLCTHLITPERGVKFVAAIKA